MKNQSLHGGFILPIQLDNFFLFRANRVSAVKRCRPARAVAQPQIENISVSTPFSKAVRYFPQACRSRRQRSVCRKRRVPVEQHIIDYGSTSLLKSYSSNSVRIFSPSPRNRTGVYHASKSKALFLKQPGILSKVFIILIALFLRFSQIILPALTYVFRRCTRSRWRSRALRGSVITARQQLEAVERVYFFAVFLREGQHFLTPRPRYWDGHRPGYLGHIFRRSRTIFSAERRRSRRAVLRCRPQR